MLKGGLLAWLLGGKSKVVGGGTNHRDGVGLWSGVSVGLYRERRGGKKQINTQNTSITKRARLMCSAGLLKNMTKSY